MENRVGGSCRSRVDRVRDWDIQHLRQNVEVNKLRKKQLRAEILYLASCREFRFSGVIVY